MPTGDRVVERYVKHPAPASGHLADGDPLDAGSVHLAHSNLSHLSERNVRLIAHVTGPGLVTADTTTSAWTDIIDATQDTATTDIYGLIPWERDANAFLCGPVALSHTRLGTSPAGLYPRKVRVVIQTTKSNQAATTLTVYAVLTASPDTPLRSQRYTTATASESNFVGATEVIFDLSLSCDTPLRPADEWRCRATTAGGGASAHIAAAWVWVGWRSSTTAINPDTVESISVFEVWS